VLVRSELTLSKLILWVVIVGLLAEAIMSRWPHLLSHMATSGGRSMTLSTFCHASTAFCK